LTIVPVLFYRLETPSGKRRRENTGRIIVSEPARALPFPTAVDALESEVREALAICGGDPMSALRITLIANAFLEAQVDRLTASASSGFARGKVRKSLVRESN
jgi:hypothetical protein